MQNRRHCPRESNRSLNARLQEAVLLGNNPRERRAALSAVHFDRSRVTFVEKADLQHRQRKRNGRVLLGLQHR